MSFAEATLWTIGSVVLVVSLYQNGTRFFPAIQHDPGPLRSCRSSRTSR